MNHYFLISLFILSSIFSFGQQNNKKEYNIHYTDKAPVIDGIAEPEIWDHASVAEDFVMYSPDLGKKEPAEYKTQVKMLYDHNALYVFAYMKDPHPEQIPAQFSTRDNSAQADYFKISLNPFNDEQNDTHFTVLSSGTQIDSKISNDENDLSWNAVWKSAVHFDDKGWYVEISIPYSALRFPKNETTNWGINFTRFRQNTKEKYVWNFIDREKGKNSEYAGILSGIKDINPPIRLSFYPYAQGSYQYNSATGEEDWKGAGGMDIKYGINDSFTLDATLIPDFSQTPFDEEILNLGPFEHQYEEKRAFFTEGTELFSKGDLFYSRRIAGRPMLYKKVKALINENEIIEDNPKRNKMYNAIKLSGRTDSGLGIGLFNALTENTYATLRDTLTGDTRKVLTHPMTDYSVLVLDQSLPHASSISFVSTNVIRSKEFDDANVNSILFKYKTKDKKYLLKTDFSMSNINTRNYGMDNFNWETGFRGKIRFKQASGSNRFGLSLEAIDDIYNKNDLGIQSYNNFMTAEIDHSYRIFKPVKNFIRIYWRNYAYMEYRYKPMVYTDNGFGSNIFLTTRKFFSFGGGIEGHFGYNYDYYEPRVEGLYYKRIQPQFANIWISTDYRKRLAIDVFYLFGTRLRVDDGYWYHNIRLSPRYRFNKRLQAIFNFEYHRFQRDEGMVDFSESGDIIFGKRDFNTVTNSAQITFYPGIKSSFALILRHYWAKVNYEDNYFHLNDDGTLSPDTYEGDNDINLNRWNMDLSYTWEFAPGSQLVALYRNKLKKNDSNYNSDYFFNLKGLGDAPLNHIVSLKLIYYLDYNRLAKH